MGMYDEVDYECVCPVCHSKVEGFQSKDGDCVLDHISPLQINNFYSSCGKCGSWLELKRVIKPTEYTLTVRGKKHKELTKYSKQVFIEEPSTSEHQ